MSNKTASKTTSKNNKNCVTKNYVAYGSNLSVEQMSVRCPDATIIGTGKIKDYKLVFRFHADIEPHKGSYVPVLVWKISKTDEERLDLYEGVAGGYYHQEEVPILMDDGTELTGMVYVMNRQTYTELPTDDYLQIIEDGYEHFGLDKKVLIRALQDAIQ